MEHDPTGSPPADARPGKERRRYRRFSVTWAGRILGFSPKECVVLNISAGGLKLRLPRGTELPERFVVWLPERGQLAAELVRLDGRNAHVKLRDDPQVVAKAVADTLPTARFLEENPLARDQPDASTIALPRS